MKATKKILGATCALVAAVALSAGSTFAWFTANPSVQVSSVNATVVTKGGDLQIGLVTYKDSNSNKSLTKDSTYTTMSDIDYSYSISDTLNTLLSGVYMDAVTSSNGYSFTDEDDATVTTKNSTNKDAAGYVEFTIALKSTHNMNIHLDVASSTTTTEKTEVTTTNKDETAYNITAWENFTDTDYYTSGKNTTVSSVSAGDTIKAEAANASRVSFAVSSASAEASVAATSAQIWAPNENAAGGGEADDASAKGWDKGNLAADYVTFMTNGTVTEKASQLTYSKTLKLADGTNYGTDDNGFITTITAGDDPTYVTIRLWIEGKDGDCFNSIFGQVVNLTLNLHGQDVTSST